MQTQDVRHLFERLQEYESRMEASLMAKARKRALGHREKNVALHYLDIAEETVLTAACYEGKDNDPALTFARLQAVVHKLRCRLAVTDELSTPEREALGFACDIARITRN